MIADEFSKMIHEDLKVHSFREKKGMSGLYGFDAKVCYVFCSDFTGPNIFLIPSHTLGC
jgi:hypothetical protein